ncbi:MAG: hypothetical protein ERJ67_07400 [Aphanocapsa feldmannii 277cV]|uniref:Uncharacterized protein n=2 Tax=Aphanocapsa feldmannii TaxID=192050 RepID=A0A524RMJ3_9CHRO|nr:MAG: hypothetical protein ERJ69_06750 [Aphanocapsa feldmannii 288cV]TGG91824.1 MAG: hypothetical protein ERJ67_07400 [Aphanocapsa feldmannii 277cV]TGH20517.1 MAG: hypothetical protein ERJ68_06760 [Aphanocapsa feldmannii 277cI]
MVEHKEPSAPVAHPHDFKAQSEVHRKIRNDADYDDWVYGTEPDPGQPWGKAPRRRADCTS